MFRRTNRQVSLLSPLDALPPGQRARVRHTWAEGFREKVYPLLLGLEGEFASLYVEDNGRPNWSVARMLGITLLQGMLDMGDQEALDALSFDFRWQYALDLWGDEAYLSRRSLVDFRARLVLKGHDAKGMRRVFDAILNGALVDLKLSTREQRLDSTRIISNVITRGRGDLFAKTLDHFVREASKLEGRAERIPAGVRQWFKQAEEGAFGWQSAADAKARLPQLAQWLVAVRDAFAEDGEVRNIEAYALVVRVIDEHITVLPPVDGTPPDPGSAASSEGTPSTPEDVRVEVHPLVRAGTALQSPYDPDAGYGHKGQGYHVQVAETCNNEGDVELITDFDVHGAGQQDQGKAQECLERLAERKLKPRTLVVDAGYTSAELLAHADASGFEVLGPIGKGSAPAGAFGRDKWTRDPETGLLAACPEGNPVVRHADRRNGSDEIVLHAFVEAAACRACPVRELCLARSHRPTSKAFHIEDTPASALRDARRTKQRDPAWRRRHRIRAGIEATNSELKRAHGLGRLRVRRIARVRIAVTAKVTGCNIKRWLRATAIRA